MSTTATFDNATTETAAFEAAPAKIRKTFFQWLMEVRARQGEARARAALATMSDARLADIGFTPDQVKHVRTKGGVPADFWTA